MAEIYYRPKLTQRQMDIIKNLVDLDLVDRMGLCPVMEQPCFTNEELKATFDLLSEAPPIEAVKEPPQEPPSFDVEDEVRLTFRSFRGDGERALAALVDMLKTNTGDWCVYTHTIKGEVKEAKETE